MIYAYSNNGNTMRAVEPDWTPSAGETFFDHLLTEDELLAAFPGRAAALAAERLRQIRASLTQALQSYLDRTAQERAYDGIVSLCSYAASTSSHYGPEGRAGVAFRDAVWDYGNQIVNDYEAGTLATIPTPEEIVAGAPKIVWPN